MNGERDEALEIFTMGIRRNPTQREKISDYLDRHGSITPIEAMRDLGVMRLAARINEMINDGEKIIKTTEKAKNRDGETVYFARYARS